MTRRAVFPFVGVGLCVIYNVTLWLNIYLVYVSL